MEIKRFTTIFMCHINVMFLSSNISIWIYKYVLYVFLYITVYMQMTIALWAGQSSCRGKKKGNEWVKLPFWAPVTSLTLA